VRKHAVRNVPDKKGIALLDILIADDNTDAADTLAELLKMLGHNAHVAYRGDRAAELADQVHPDVAFLDIAM
jgi:CheY-like chemotaxis protein